MIPKTPNPRFLRRIAVLSFFAVLFVTLGQSVLNMKDTNDTWILEGILPFFLLLTFLFVLIAVYSSDVGLVTILTSVYIVAINLIPQLKYFFVYGTFDPLVHYQFIQDMVRLGFVPSTDFYSVQYASSAGSHILVSELSILPGFDVLIAYKLFLAISPCIIPLAIYVAYKRLNMSTDLAKIILVSSVISSPVLYVFTGRAAIFPLYFLFICLALLTVCIKSHSRASWVIVTLIGIRIIISHDVTTFFLLAVLFSLLILQLFNKPFKPSFGSKRSFTFLGMTFLALGFAHFIFTSNSNLVTLISLFRNLVESLLMERPPGAITYYAGFYQLSFLDRFSVLVVRLGRDIISLSLSILAPLALYRMKLNINVRKFYYALFIPATIALIIFITSQFTRSNFVDRGLGYFAAFSPFLVGITIYWLTRSKHQRLRNIILSVLMFSLILVSFLEFYPCQPLVPKVSSNSVSYYVMDLREANTIYQRYMLYFLNAYDNQSSVTTDVVTRFLMYALSNPTINAMVVGGNPLDPRTTAQLILVSLDINAHPIVSGTEAIQYFQDVANATMNRSIIYTNGKSCILLNSGGH